MDFLPVVVVHPVGGEHQVDTAEQLESFLNAGWVQKPARQLESGIPAKKARRKSKEKGD